MLNDKDIVGRSEFMILLQKIKSLKFFYGRVKDRFFREIEEISSDSLGLWFNLKQSKEIYLNAVGYNGLDLRFIRNQTPEICLTAVKQNGEALKYVKNQTSEISLEAVKQKG